LNYLSHAYRFLNDPYFVAGLATPDWLRVIGREFRFRKHRAIELATDLKDSEHAKDSIRFFQGVVQHHADDAWFHQSEAFQMLNARLAVSLRELHGPEASIRSHFLAHITIELLLDSFLAEEEPGLLDRYYATIRAVDSQLIARLTENALGRDVPSLANWIERFEKERFLHDYAEDTRLLFRLNQVMRRVGLEQLGEETLEWLSNSRKWVYEHSTALLSEQQSE
jgi:hypothetical protein